MMKRSIASPLLDYIFPLKMVYEARIKKDIFTNNKIKNPLIHGIIGANSTAIYILFLTKPDRYYDAFKYGKNFLYDMGLRTGDALQISLEDIDMYEKTLFWFIVINTVCYGINLILNEIHKI